MKPRERSFLRGIHFGIASRRIYWKTATIFTPSRKCSGTKNVSTTMIYTHVLNKPGLAIRSPLDDQRPVRGRHPTRS